MANLSDLYKVVDNLKGRPLQGCPRATIAQFLDWRIITHVAVPFMALALVL